jgi:hypothetical protein
MEQTPKEWADRILQNFGRRKPRGIELRGDGKSIHFNLHEVALVRIFNASRSYYREKEMTPDTNLVSQERTLHILGGSFDLDMQHELSSSLSNFDFIPRPELAESYYSVGLADLIFITDLDELPYLLDFQFYNHVTAEKFDQVRFLQILHFYVVHLLKTRYSVVPTKQLRLFQKWIYSKVSSLDACDTKKFYWYQDGYEWKELDESQPKSETNLNPMQELVANTDTSGGILSTDNIEIEPVVLKPKGVNVLAILKYSCTKRQLEGYFGLLKQDNPTKGEPMLNSDAVDWMIGYYFEVNGACTLSNKPDFKVNINKLELMHFIYRFSEDISRKGNGNETSPKTDFSRILTECFEDIFGKNHESLATRLKGETAKRKTAVMKMIDSYVKDSYVNVSDTKPKGLKKRNLD